MKDFMKSTFIVLLVLSLIPMMAQATPYGFYNITNNNPGDAAIGEAQLFVDVTNYGTNQVLFTFGNTGPNASSITDVYYDDGSLLGIAGFIDADENSGDSGVNFTQSASPTNLPGGNSLSPNFSTDFSADSDNPPPQNGVNPGESLGIFFELKSGKSFNDVISELESDILRIGIHVQGFDGGGSESFVNNKVPIPEPSTVILLGFGLLTLAGITARKKIKK